MTSLRVYIASSFRHLHAVRLLSRAMRSMGYTLLDWTEKATPPEGLSPSERRAWMDTDHGGEVFAFCERACREAHFVIYLGASGQDAGVEAGIAHGCGVPVLGVRGPLEAPGLMLYGVGDVWVESVEDTLALLADVRYWADQGAGHGAEQQVALSPKKIPPLVAKLLGIYLKECAHAS